MAVQRASLEREPIIDNLQTPDAAEQLHKTYGGVRRYA